MKIKVVKRMARFEDTGTPPVQPDFDTLSTQEEWLLESRLQSEHFTNDIARLMDVESESKLKSSNYSLLRRIGNKMVSIFYQKNIRAKTSMVASVEHAPKRAQTN